jgi:hypothetical protein
MRSGFRHLRAPLTAATSNLVTVKANVEAWGKLTSQLATTDASPPIAVHLLALALLNGAEAVDGYAEYEPLDASTIWRNWLITESLIVYTDVEFPATNYEQTADDRARQTNPSGIEPTVREASIRPICDVKSLRIGSVGGELTGFRRDWYPIGDLVLTFSDGTAIPLPGQMAVPNYGRDRSDAFLAAVRQRIGL